jgi:hypothetical protein
MSLLDAILGAGSAAQILGSYGREQGYRREYEQEQARIQAMRDQMNAQRDAAARFGAQAGDLSGVKKWRKTIDVEFEVVDNRSQYHILPAIVSTALEGTPAGGLGPGEQAKS